MQECTFSERTQPSRIKNDPPAAHDNPYFQRLQQIAFGHAFEKLRPEIETRWGRGTQARRDWPRIVDFCYHIRNGAFHGNTFNITVPVHDRTVWRGAKITMDLQDTQVMGLREGFLGIADVIALLFDFQRSFG